MADETTDTPLRSFAERIRPAAPEVPLDAIDVQLLTELAKDARAPQRALADVLGMSSPAVADRIARLKAKGVIRGFSVDIDWEALGHSTVAYLSIKAAVGFDQSRVFETLMSLRGVEEISVVTGANDMVVKIRAHGFDDLRQILANDVWGIAGVQQTETSIVLVRAEPDDVDARMLQALLPSGDEG